MFFFFLFSFFPRGSMVLIGCLARELTRLLLILSDSLAAMQFMQVSFGFASATETVFQAYVFELVGFFEPFCFYYGDTWISFFFCIFLFAAFFVLLSFPCSPICLVEVSSSLYILSLSFFFEKKINKKCYAFYS